MSEEDLKFTAQEMISAIMATAKAEKACSNRDSARFQRQVSQLLQSQEDASRRLRRYVLTGDPAVLREQML